MSKDMDLSLSLEHKDMALMPNNIEMCTFKTNEIQVEPGPYTCNVLY